MNTAAEDRVQELEREVERLRALVKRTRDEGQASLDGFVYSVSHDLRGPLRTIMASSMIVMEDYADQLNSDARDQLQAQAKAAKKLSGMLDDLLKLSRLARDGVRKEPIDLSRIAGVSAASLGIEDIDIEPGLHEEADPTYVRQLFDILLQNSVNFSDKSTPLAVEVGKETADGEAAFFVRDNGIGFRESDAARIFTPFERIHKEGDYPGAGMGLAYAKRIVDRHGGRIWAEGRDGEGATVYFTLK